jgi:LuxR family maltose regulon positive regulatory protein
LSVILESPLTIVEAPLGYGKTVAVREFLRESQTRAVWVSVNGASEHIFWQNFCLELARLPETAESAKALLRLRYPYDDVSRDEARNLLLRSPLAEPTVLVVDDLHLISKSADFAGLCETLARRGIPDLHIVGITRHLYEGDKVSLIMKGFLAHIGPEILAFEAGEIQEYCALCQLPVSQNQALALHTAMGGWISGVYLHLRHYEAHGAFSLPAPENDPIRSGGGLAAALATSDLPAELVILLEEQLYAPLPPESKKLLFLLCPLQHFTVHQADFLYDGDTRELLGELVHTNSFVSLDKGSGVYSPHAIFRYPLLRLFHELPLERRQEIHIRCGDWFARTGEFVAAMEQYHEAEAFEKAFSLLEKDMHRYLVTENAAFFTAMFQACPPEILDRHIGAVFKHALALLSVGDKQGFGARCAWLTAKCAALPEGPEADSWKGELATLMAMTKYNDIAAMSALHRKAYALLGRPTQLYGPDSPWTLGCPSVLFMFHRARGKLKEETGLMHECMPPYYQLTNMHGAGGEYLTEAEALYHAGDFSRAGVVCREAEAMAERTRQTGNLICALFLRLRLALACGRGRETLELAGAVRALISRSQEYYLLYTADMCEGWLYSILGAYSRMAGWLLEGVSRASRVYAFAKGWLPLVQGRALLQSGEFPTVIGEFNALLKDEVCDQHRLLFLYAHIYLAAAHQGLGDKCSAAKALRMALDEARPDDLYMPFVENSDYILPILRALKRGRHQQGIQRILTLAEAWNTHIQAVKKITAISAPSPAVTAAEQELIRLLTNGESFKEIAYRQNLSYGRVKNKFSDLYKRFGVHSRSELLKRLTEGACNL